MSPVARALCQHRKKTLQNAVNLKLQTDQESRGHIIGRMLQIVALVELGLCFVAWTMAFLKPRQKAAEPAKAAGAPASKWGIFLEMVGFALAWTYVRPVGFEKSNLALIGYRHRSTLSRTRMGGDATSRQTVALRGGSKRGSRTDHHRSLQCGAASRTAIPCWACCWPLVQAIHGGRCLLRR